MLIGALVGFFPVVINTAVGLTQLDAELLDLGRVFGAPEWKGLNLELLRVWGEASAGQRKTILFVTHSIPEVVFLATAWSS